MKFEKVNQLFEKNQIIFEFTIDNQIKFELQAEVIKMNLQSNISEYLKSKGITQSFLAEHTGMTANALNLALNGNRKLVADEYIKICNALEVPYDFFINKPDKPV